MVDKRALSISLSVDLLLVFVISNVENADSHMYDVEKGEQILQCFFAHYGVIISRVLTTLQGCGLNK